MKLIGSKKVSRKEFCIRNQKQSKLEISRRYLVVAPKINEKQLYKQQFLYTDAKHDLNENENIFFNNGIGFKQRSIQCYPV